MVEKNFFFKTFPYFKFFLIVSISISFVLSVVIMQIALDHNPMGEYCYSPDDQSSNQDCIIDWSHLISLGSINFFGIFALLIVVYFIFLLPFHLINRLLKQKKK